MGASPDTLQYRWNNRLFSSDTVSGPRSGIVGIFDTTWNELIIFGHLVDARDGRTYRTVRIGSRIWMAENLNFKGAGFDSGWAYNNSPDSARKYGRLYAWTSVVGLPDTCDSAACGTLLSSRTRGICPIGWHVPSEEEFQSLEMTLGMSAVDAATSGFRGKREGANLKSRHADTWREGLGGDDIYGFRGMPSGCFNAFGFETIHMDNFFWSATETDSSAAMSRVLSYAYPQIYRQNYPKFWGFSLRCIQDD